MDARYWHDQGREVTRERYVEARAKRYRDGGWKGCIVTPTARGVVAVCVEIDPREARRAQELLKDGHAQLARAVAPMMQADTVGDLGWHAPDDIVGELFDRARQVATPLARELRRTIPAQGSSVARGAVDIVGDLGSILRQAATSLPGAFTSAGGAALGSLARGASAEDSARSALESFGASTGLAGAAQSAGAALAPILGYPADVRSPEELQARRDRALRELAIVAPTHGANDWLGAVTYHARNGGITGFRADGTGEADRLLRDRGELARLPQAHPALEAQQQAPTQRLAPSSQFRSAASAMGADAPAALYSAPGAASQGVSGRLEDIGPTLGAEELARQASGLAIPQAASVIRSALLGVDATAGAQLGDPRARAVLRRAIESESRRARSALLIAQSLLDLR